MQVEYLSHLDRYTAQVTVDDTRRMEPVDRIQAIQKERWELLCGVCRQRCGAKVGVNPKPWAASSGSRALSSHALAQPRALGSRARVQPVQHEHLNICQCALARSEDPAVCMLCA